MEFLKRQTIRRQFLTAICVLLVPILVGIAWSANRTRLEQQQEVRQYAAAVAVTAAAHLDQYITGLDALAAAMLRHPGVAALQTDCCEQLFADVLAHQPLLTNIVLTAADGTLRAAGALPSPPLWSAPISGSWVQQVVAAGQPVVSDWYKGAVTGKPVVTFGYPVRDGRNTVVGALGLSVDLSRMQVVFSQVPLPDASVITLVDRSGLVLARSVDAERYIGTSIDTPPAAITDADFSLSRSADGVERVEVTDQVMRGRWLLSVAIPRSFVLERLEPLWRRNITIVSLAALTLLGLGVLIVWQTTKHLNRMRSAAEQIAGGNLTPPPRAFAPNLELAELQEAFIQMARNLRETRDALDRQVEQERKMNETLHSLQRQVVRQERLAAVGVLVSGVAHELNNPLQAILGTLELLERQGGLPPAALEEISFVKTQAGRAREIIRNLSRFSSQQSGPPEPVDLREVVAEIVQLRRRHLDTSGVVLDVEVRSSRKVQANFTELEQVTLNFVINAQQSVESAAVAGRIVIRVFDVGRKVCLEVLDNGRGVDPADEPKLFQPFFTTKPVGKGTGLGLSVSYGIIESYGGSIGYRRNDWGGATFFFELPAIEAAEAQHDQAAVLHRTV